MWATGVPASAQRRRRNAPKRRRRTNAGSLFPGRDRRWGEPSGEGVIIHRRCAERTPSVSLCRAYSNRRNSAVRLLPPILRRRCMEFKDYSTEQRIIAPYHHIDPGFINKRLCFSTFGRGFVAAFDQVRNKAGDTWSELQNNHLLVEMALRTCRNNGVRSLAEVLHEGKEQAPFCSTEELEGTNDVYTSDRVRNRVVLPFEFDKDVWLEFGTEHFVADTGKAEQAQRSKVSIIGGIRRIDENAVTLYPLIMGAPSFEHPLNREFNIDLSWHGWDWYEIFPQDINEFSRIKDTLEPSVDEWAAIMSILSEQEVKQAFCEILGDIPKKDSPAEQDDHFTSSVHLGDERVVAGFIFKGPGNGFREMTLDQLGKRADQIYRLASSPARLLIVQHCHQIGEAVYETLRRFAVTPHNPRRYCLMNGKDTYKILRSFGKV